MVDTWNTNTSTYPDVDPANDYQVGEKTGSYVGTGSGYDFSGTGTTNNNQVSPGHPSGGYDEYLNPPVVTQPLPVDGRSEALQSAADESVNSYLRAVALKMQGMENPPLAIDPETGQAIRSGGFRRIDPETGELDLTSGHYYTDPETGEIIPKWFDIKGVGDKGALLSDLERAQLDANLLNKGLGSIIATNDYGEPIFDSSGNVIYTGLGRHLQDQWGKGMNVLGTEGIEAGEEFYDQLIDDYWKQRYAFDADWHGSDWDEFLGAPWKPETASMTDPNWWSQIALSDIDPTGFADLQRIYGKEFEEERMAAPHAWGIEPFSETIIEGDY
jgi:hypothetical protein